MMIQKKNASMSTTGIPMLLDHFTSIYNTLHKLFLPQFYKQNFLLNKKITNQQNQFLKAEAKLA